MSKYYYELSITPKKDNYDFFLDLLENLTDEAIEEDEGSIIARSEEPLDDVAFGIEAFAKKLNVDCKVILEKKDNIDWIKKYQESVKSIEIGNFFIRPEWEEKREDKIDIIINPALSFGSGHHETTNSCVVAIDKYVNENDTVLDVGTGSGILAIAAAKKGCVVDVCDTDEVCVVDTESNFELNGVKANNSWVGSCGDAKKEYDVVIANIVADVLVIIANELKNCLKKDGILIISGILDKHIKRVLNKFKDLEGVEVIQKNEWFTVVFKK